MAAAGAAAAASWTAGAAGQPARTGVTHELVITAADAGDAWVGGGDVTVADLHAVVEAMNGTRKLMSDADSTVALTYAGANHVLFASTLPFRRALDVAAIQRDEHAHWHLAEAKAQAAARATSSAPAQPVAAQVTEAAARAAGRVYAGVIRNGDAAWPSPDPDTDVSGSTSGLTSPSASVASAATAASAAAGAGAGAAGSTAAGAGAAKAAAAPSARLTSASTSAVLALPLPFLSASSTEYDALMARYPVRAHGTRLTYPDPRQPDPTQLQWWTQHAHWASLDARHCARDGARRAPHPALPDALARLRWSYDQRLFEPPPPAAAVQSGAPRVAPNRPISVHRPVWSLHDVLDAAATAAAGAAIPVRTVTPNEFCRWLTAPADDGHADDAPGSGGCGVQLPPELVRLIICYGGYPAPSNLLVLHVSPCAHVFRRIEVLTTYDATLRDLIGAIGHDWIRGLKYSLTVNDRNMRRLAGGATGPQQHLDKTLRELGLTHGAKIDALPMRNDVL